jgi:hypothetical protein
MVLSGWRFILPKQVPAIVVAVFDRAPDTQEILEHAFVTVGMRVHHMSSAVFAASAEAIRSELETAGVTVVIWDISPALSGECAAFESLYHAGAFRDCQVVLTTTNTAALRRHQSPSCAKLALLQKPYDIMMLLDALDPDASISPAAQP